MSETPHPFSILCPPYTTLTPLSLSREALRREGRRPGSALVWAVGACPRADVVPLVEARPGGLALLVILPPARGLSEAQDFLHALERVRPAGVLPHHADPRADDLADILRMPPRDLGVEVTEYLRWRGFHIDRGTVHLLRRAIELSHDVRSISALSRSVYLSRRALGRRFTTRGLPVPSHWLHFARLLRVILRLQSTDQSVISAGYEVGYPDGFSLSNQMMRLTGFRPSDARRFLGWEWFIEAWLRREAEMGALNPHLAQRFLPCERVGATDPASMNTPAQPRERPAVRSRRSAG